MIPHPVVYVKLVLSRCTSFIIFRLPHITLPCILPKNKDFLLRYLLCEGTDLCMSVYRSLTEVKQLYIFTMSKKEKEYFQSDLRFLYPFNWAGRYKIGYEKNISNIAIFNSNYCICDANYLTTPSLIR